MASSPRIVPTVIVNVSSATDTTLVAAQPGQKVRVWQLALENTHASTDCSVTFKSSTGPTAISGTYLLKAGGGAITLQYTEMAWFNSNLGDGLVLTTSAAGTITGTVNYSIEQ
jgi:hypothetical protein